MAYDVVYKKNTRNNDHQVINNCKSQLNSAPVVNPIMIVNACNIVSIQR